MIETVFDILNEINKGNFENLPEKIKIDGVLYIKVDDKDDPDVVYVSEDGTGFLDDLKYIYKLKEILRHPVKEIKEYKRWKPELAEEYWFVNIEGVVGINHWLNNDVDKHRYLTRNCFKTQEEAQEHACNIKTYYELRDLAIELNEGEGIDWTNSDQWKYYIYYDFDDECLKQDWYNTIKDAKVVYCLDKDFFVKAMKKIGEEKLIKLFKEE